MQPKLLENIFPAQIICKRLADEDSEPPEGFVRIEPTVAACWEGREDGFVAFSTEIMTDRPDMLSLFPWNLEQVAKDDHCVYAMRAEHVGLLPKFETAEQMRDLIAGLLEQNGMKTKPLESTTADCFHAWGSNGRRFLIRID